MTTKVLRSLTYTVDIDRISDPDYKRTVGGNIGELRRRFTDEDLFVRTVRINVKAICGQDRVDRFAFLRKVELLSAFAQEIGVRWFNVVFDLSSQNQKNVINYCSIAYQIVKTFDNAFVNMVIANEGVINPCAALEASKLVLNASRLTHNGYDNFRIGMALNPVEGTPFFPFSFATVDNSFSIAVETAQQIESALQSQNVSATYEVRERIVDSLSGFARQVEDVAVGASSDLELTYAGMDLSIAPYPDEHISVVKILNMLGLDDIGASGTLFYTSLLTDLIKHTLDKAGVRPAGFNGVMYSLLEDNLMCEANNKKWISIDSIISYSTLCGCGLDMVPVPGNLLPEELGAIVMDVAAISLRLNKPLGVRVLPIPNGGVNEFTQFDMDFLTNTRIVEVKNKYFKDSLFSDTSYTYFKTY